MVITVVTLNRFQSSLTTIGSKSTFASFTETQNPLFPGREDPEPEVDTSKVVQVHVGNILGLGTLENILRRVVVIEDAGGRELLWTGPVSHP